MNKVDVRSFYCLVVPTLVGETGLILRFTGNTANDMVGILLALILSAAAVFIIKWITDLTCRAKRKVRFLETAFLIFGSLALFFTATLTAYRFSQYVSKVMLAKNITAIAFLLFSVLCVLIGLKSKELLLKLAVLLFVPTVLFILIMFIFSVRFMEIKYLIPYKDMTVTGCFSVFWSLWPYLTLSGVAVVALGEKTKKRHFIFFYLISGVQIGLFTVNVLGIFGSEFANTLNYPYSSAVATASLGHVFSRLDVLLYGVAFFTCLLKTSVCFFGGIRLLTKSLEKIL